ncbi:MAG TPA: high-potential iron-sulfur protein [Pseudobdellovibrionaceae bacterium]
MNRLMKRREFFKNMAKISGVAIAAPALISAFTGKMAFAEEGRRKKSGDAGSQLVDPSEATAKAVGYVEESTKSPKAAGNKCANCILFVKPEKKNGKEVGSCAIFPNKFVVANGYCNSWAKKA